MDASEETKWMEMVKRMLYEMYLEIEKYGILSIKTEDRKYYK